MNVLLSLPTTRTSPAADRFRTIGRLVFAALLLVANASTPAQARGITIPPKIMSVFSVSGSPNVPTVFIWDHFNRINTSSLGRAVVGGNWSATSGSWTIAANKAKSTIAPNARATLSVPGIGPSLNPSLNPSMVNGQLEADLTFGSTAEAGLDFLDDGINNMVVLYKKGAGTSQVRLYSLLDFGAQPGGLLPTPVAQFDVAPTTSAALKVRIYGNVIELWWNNALIITYGLTPPEITALKDPGSDRIGFWAESDALSRFDNLRLQTLPGSP
jgi:hypothetical protein